MIFIRVKCREPGCRYQARVPTKPRGTSGGMLVYDNSYNTLAKRLTTDQSLLFIADIYPFYPPDCPGSRLSGFRLSGGHGSLLEVAEQNGGDSCQESGTTSHTSICEKNTEPSHRKKAATNESTTTSGNNPKVDAPIRK